MNLKFDIPNIAKGTMLPPQIQTSMLKNEQERKQTKRRDRIAIYALIVSVLSFAVSIIALVR